MVAIENYAAVSDIAGARQNGIDWYNWLVKGRGLPTSHVQLLTDYFQYIDDWRL